MKKELKFCKDCREYFPYVNTNCKISSTKLDPVTGNPMYNGMDAHERNKNYDCPHYRPASLFEKIIRGWQYND